MSLHPLPTQQEEKEPTEKQLGWLRWIQQYRQEKGYCPALTEFPADRGNLERLRRNGWATWEADLLGRTLRLSPAGEAVLAKQKGGGQ